MNAGSPTPGPDFIPTFEPEVWRGVEGRALRDAMIDNGFGETVRAVDALQDVNAAELARIALTVYGVSGDYGAADVPEGADFDATDINSARAELSGIADELDYDFLKNVEPSWSGDAYSAYSAYKSRLVRETQDEGEERLVLIGDQLLNLARAIQLTQREQEITAIGGASLLVSAGGLASAAVFGLMLSTVGSLIALGEVLQDEADRAAIRTAVTTDYASRLERPNVVRMKIDDLRLPDIGDPEDWEAR